MSEYTDKILERAGLKKGAKSIIIDSKKIDRNYEGSEDFGADAREDAYVPTEKGLRQIEELGNPEILFTPTGIYAIAGSSKKEQDEREKVLAELATDPEKVANLTSEERRFLQNRGYSRNEDKRSPSGRVTDQLASMFMDGKEPSAFWTGKKPTYKKTR